MAPEPNIMQAVEQLGYRVTVGDVATQAGLDINLAQRGLLTLATNVGGHLQVADTGDVVYLFPKSFRTVLRNKFLRLRLQEWWKKIWAVLFYLIRISFGIVLLLSIVLIVVTIYTIIIAASQSSNNSNNRSQSSGGFFMPYFWIGPDWFWFFNPNYGSTRYRQQRQRERKQSGLNFFEAIFSFLFGDGDPNADLEERRWRQVAAVIRHNKGAVVAEQIAPYLDNVGTGFAKEYEDYMLPALTRFNGQPAVSPDGQIVYHFPELQTLAQQRQSQPVASYLQELPWRFSAASSGQIVLATGLGALNFVGGLVLGNLLANGTAAAKLGGLVAFAQSIYWLLLGYGTAFLTVPLVRYFWIQWRNRRISDRNLRRQAQAQQLDRADDTLRRKIAYARQFAAETVIGQENLVYTTETDLMDQADTAETDAEWQRRLRESGS